MNDQTSTTSRSPSVAATLSALLPGLGHIYCGQLVRGLAWMTGCVLLIMAATAVLVAGGSAASLKAAGWLLAAEAALWLASMAGAWRAARPFRSGGFRLHDFNVWPVYAALALLGGFSSALGLAFVLRERVACAYRLPTASMAPTIKAGELILAWKDTFLDRTPERGELVVFRHAENRRHFYIKRVIALAGDRVEWREDGQITVNGTVLAQTAAGPDGSCEETNGSRNYTVSRAGGAPADPAAKGSLVVAPGHCFVLGDNRNFSNDSRQFGAVSYASLHARPWAKLGWGGTVLR